MDNCLRTKQVEIKHGHSVLFSNLNLTFLPHQITAVIGENGIGKSSLLNCLSAVKSPSQGSVLWGDINLPRLPPRQRARYISSMGQIDTCPGDLRVEERIAQGLSARLGFHVLIDKEILKQVEKISEELDISHLLGRCLQNLSGGEKKRVHIARALIDEQASIYLLDEPDAGLDLRHREALIDILRRRAVLGKIVIVTLHDLMLCRLLADRILVLGKKSIAADGPSNLVLTKKFIQEQFGVRILDL